MRNLQNRSDAHEVRAHVELAAVEENHDPEVFEVAEAPRSGLEGLYRRVVSFRDGVRDPAVEPRKQAVQMPLQRLGGLDHGL